MQDWYGVINGISTWDEAVSVGADIVQNNSDASWYLGDLVNRVSSIRAKDPLVNPKIKTLKAFSQEILQSYSVVKDAARVSRSVPEEKREEFATLCYGHWREIVRRGHREKVLLEWAIRAADNGWSVTRLRYELRGKDLDIENVLNMIKTIGARQKQIVQDQISAVARGAYEEIAEALTTAEDYVRRIRSALDQLAVGTQDN